jgi:hypothetical protein
VLKVLQRVVTGAQLQQTLVTCFDLCVVTLKRNCQHELKERICYALLHIAANTAPERSDSDPLPASIRQQAGYTLMHLCNGCRGGWMREFLQSVRRALQSCSTDVTGVLQNLLGGDTTHRASERCELSDHSHPKHTARPSHTDRAGRAQTSSISGHSDARSSIYENSARRTSHYEPASRRHSRSRSRTAERSSRTHERARSRTSERSTRGRARSRSRSRSRSRTQQQQQQQQRRHKSQSSRRRSDSRSRSSSSSRQQQQQRRRDSSSARSDAPSVANTTASAAPSAKWSKKQEAPTARASSSSTAHTGHSKVALAIAAAPDAVAAIPNQVPLVSLTRNHETKAAEPPDMMNLSANEWNALSKAADKLKYDVKDKPSQLYFGKKLNLKSTQVKILCTEARVPTAPAQVLDEDEFYSIVEHIVKKAEEIEYYVKERENRVRQLKTGKNANTNTNSSSNIGSCCGEGSSARHAAAVPASVPILSSSSERSMSPHDVCSSKVKVEHDALHTAAATIDSGTAIDSGTTAAEYRNGDATAGYGDAYTYSGVPQQVRYAIIVKCLYSLHFKGTYFRNLFELLPVSMCCDGVL